jgi:fatty acid desaturase
MVERRRRRIEWPTIALAVTIYGLWLLLTWFHAALPAPLLLLLGGWTVAWYGSLQHELIHGHPTRWPAVNRALGVFPLMPHLPFDRYRAIHLAHHRDEYLTDPLEDPETQYFTPPAWMSLGRAGRMVVRITARLAGRLLIGPVWAIGRFLWRDAARAWNDVPGVRRAWAWHLPLLAVMLVWVVGVCRMSPLTYALCFWLPGMALLLMRSLAEHRAADAVEHRTAIVEAAPVLGLLYLYNNLHAAHHERPGVAWYRLPALYARDRGRLIARNGGLVYHGYADVARRFLLHPHDQSVHPFARPRAGSRGSGAGLTLPVAANDEASAAPIAAG